MYKNIFEFKNNIQKIAIEINSNCNRKCVYCPHSIREVHPKKISLSLLSKILNELSSYDYDKKICLNVFNEPLFYYDHLLSCIYQIKSVLPKAHIYFSTNGDFLNKDKLDELINYGLGSLVISTHTNKYSDDYCLDNVLKITRNYNFSNFKLDFYSNRSVSCNVMYRNIPIKIFSVNFIKYGQNRAETMKEKVKVPLNFKREKKCNRPQNEIHIHWDGTVYPCCQFFHGISSKNFILGNVNEQNLVEIYNSHLQIYFRDMCSLKINFSNPCLTCTE